MKKSHFFTLVFLILSVFSRAQNTESNTTTTTTTTQALVEKVSTPEKKWYEVVNLRGYMQVRYNRLLESNSDLKIDQIDKSIGDKNGFFIRRGRLILSGQVTKNISFYIQPDFASSVDDSKQNFLQLRDAYADVGLDSKNELRLRIGQSKVPYGFENMQSSQNRLSLDRGDAMNSGVVGERDLGVFAYWIPERKKKLFADLAKEGLKTSGEYGLLAFGLYNGQTINMKEMNNDLHMVARITYPFEIKNQVVETSIQAYKGKFVLPSVATGVITDLNNEYNDERVGVTFVLYPKPFGIQAEYNIGKGPEFDVKTNSVITNKLEGGYITASYFTKIKNDKVIPFARYQYYDGGFKTQKNATSHKVNEMEFGVEWQPSKYFELTATYNINSRRYENVLNQDNLQKGNMLRLQAQISF